MSKIKDPDTLLLIALAVATIGMILVVLGTVHGAMFTVGVIVSLDRSVRRRRGGHLRRRA